MSDINALPGLKEILGALIFGANRPLKFRELRDCIIEVAQNDPEVAIFAEVEDKQLREALKELESELATHHLGFNIYETAGGYRLRSNASCGRWLKHLLKTKPQRLSQPALETLAIIAYRQPLSKSDIESIRGVSVGHIIKSLMEMRLVRITGRSELPGRPFLYGTTQMFLEHFGLKNLKELDKMAPTILSRRELKDADAARELAKQKERERKANPELPFGDTPQQAPEQNSEPAKDDEESTKTPDEQTGD